MTQSRDDDRPKRSWSEIDKQRDSGSRRQSRDERAQDRLSRTPAYEQYKAQVSRMFEGGAIPEAMRDKLDPDGSQKARDEGLRKIRQLAAEDRKGWSEAVARYVEAYPLPDDGFLLTEWLDHPREAVVIPVLAHLDRLMGEGILTGAKIPKSLVQRLRSLELNADDPRLQDAATALRGRLA